MGVVVFENFQGLIKSQTPRTQKVRGLLILFITTDLSKNYCPHSHFKVVIFLKNLKIYFLSFFSVTYRKKTKAQFARDDPAFLVLLAGWLVVSS